MRALAVLALLLGATTAARADDMRVAVLEFDNASTDAELAPLGKGLQSMLTTDLAKVGALRVVERQRLQDVRGEIALARGAGFDPRTAAKIGKLVGATHLFGGSVSVVGDKMRLDGRLLAVTSGEVLLAEQIVGEKALFFELEQELVKKVVAALGVRVEPKEKAALLRPHTADFRAFQKFSAGISAHDDGRLAQAAQALREAAAIDADFELAALTLAEYERLASQVQNKADAARDLEEERRRLEKNQAVAAELATVKRLWAIADRPASGHEARARRVAALCALARAYESSFRAIIRGARGRLREADFAAAGYDSFTLARMADAVYQKVWAESPALAPKASPLCLDMDVVGAGEEDLERALRAQVAAAEKGAARRDQLVQEMSSQGFVDGLAARLAVDPAGVARVWEDVYALAARYPGLTDDERVRFEQGIAERRRRAGDVAGATKLLATASRRTSDARLLRELAAAIERNKEQARVLDGAPPLLREYALLDPDRKPDDLEKLRASDGLEVRVAHARRLSRGEKLRFDDVLVWAAAVGGSTSGKLYSGPQTVAGHSAELRYHGDACRGVGGRSRSNTGVWTRCEDPVVVSTGRSGATFAAEITVATAPPPEWRHISREAPGAGAAGIAFGLANVIEASDVPPHQGEPLLLGWAVLLDGARARLVELTRGETNEVVMVGEAAIAAPRGPRRLAVALRGGKLEVSVDGQRVALPWKPRRDPGGFAGYLFHGPGFASLSAPVVR